MKVDNFIITNTRVSRKHLNNFIAYLEVQGLDIYYVNTADLFGWDVVFGTTDISIHTRASKQCTIIDDVIYTTHGVFANNKTGIKTLHSIINDAIEWDTSPTTQTTRMHIQIENLPTL